MAGQTLIRLESQIDLAETGVVDRCGWSNLDQIGVIRSMWLRLESQIDVAGHTLIRLES